jgi:hypothetical protein
VPVALSEDDAGVGDQPAIFGLACHDAVAVLNREKLRRALLGIQVFDV